MRIHQLQEQDQNPDLDIETLTKEVQELNQRFAEIFGDQPLTEDQTDWDPIVVDLKNKLRANRKTDYASIDRVMKDVCTEWSCNVHKLHDQFMDREGQSPDDWIKSKRFGS